MQALVLLLQQQLLQMRLFLGLLDPLVHRVRHRLQRLAKRLHLDAVGRDSTKIISSLIDLLDVVQHLIQRADEERSMMNAT